MYGTLQSFRGSHQSPLIGRRESAWSKRGKMWDVSKKRPDINIPVASEMLRPMRQIGCKRTHVHLYPLFFFSINCEIATKAAPTRVSQFIHQNQDLTRQKIHESTLKKSKIDITIVEVVGRRDNELMEQDAKTDIELVLSLKSITLQ